MLIQKHMNYIGPDLLFPAGPDLLFQIGAGAILSKYAETMRMVSQSSILESPESLCIPICIHTPDSIAIPAQGPG